MVSEWSRVWEEGGGVNKKKSDFQRCASWIPPPPGYHRVPGRRPSEECSRQRGKKAEFYRSSQPDLLPAAVNQRSCVMAKHTSTGCLRPLAQPALRSHPKTQGQKSMLVQMRARILTKAPVFPSVGFIFSPADISFPDVLLEDQ